MIHLFKRVYVSSDKLTETRNNRIIVSKTHGNTGTTDYDGSGTILHASLGVDDLIGHGQTFTTWVEFFKFVDNFSEYSQKKLIIYADDKSAMRIMSAWFKFLLPNSDKQHTNALIESLVFKHNAFHRSRLSTILDNQTLDSSISSDSLSEQYDLVTNVGDISLLEYIKPYAGVEFLLATYLSSGKMKEELKETLVPLISKDLEKYLFELKEIFYVHLLTPQFSHRLQLSQKRTFLNLKTVLDDDSDFVELFTNDRIWNSVYMDTASSAYSNIRFDNISPHDVEMFKKFTTEAGDTWNEESVYHQIKSDVNKLDFLGIFTDFTDELLNKIIDTESTFEHSAGSFFSIDLETVNHYFITALLDARTNNQPEFINRYSLL